MNTHKPTNIFEKEDKDKSSWLGVKLLSAEIHAISEDVNIPITPALTQIPVQGPLDLNTSPQVLSTDSDTDVETVKVSSVATAESSLIR